MAAGCTRRTTLLAAGALLASVALGHAAAGDPAPNRPVVRAGVLKFGTVSWELDTVRANNFDKQAGIDLQLVELAGNPATQVALQAGAVEIIVSDWLWVSRMRSKGEALCFIPYSTAVGALVVPANSGIAGVGDLRGKRIGVAGSPLDKSWLLLKALAADRHGLSLDRDVQPFFAAPPLLNSKIADGDLDAVLTFWPFAARLEAKGMRVAMTVSDMLEALGQTATLPSIGYVFREEWARANPAALAGFQAATGEAKTLLAQSDAAWDRLAPLMQAEDDATFRTLRDRYREGIPRRWTEEERAGAARLYALLARLGGRELVGDAPTIAPGTFWTGGA
ncbi:NitT/TauT family transport system substrate-binding protein [Azospirillum lipoferum]|uniref:ABC transporter substrate-binding protein n=1 Tax=Azospirillum lipoferum TaxID=193 RepID=A0A5A9GFK2_AZOLI|nr:MULTISPECIES: ABC transporter substrate-binding protein [Azospirillum]KAA0592595.1 ABC transporter substrate-binding protein [Azospirillum lipoferum]MCP1614414.1 NitT/TauT family transport system substrate-binding protein [Azospirillum lipoferum]MDW5532754.1 ABC transporter substrate-binding protein [Azospirillum sp. NL1]